MCRLFAVLAVEPVRVNRAFKALCEQSKEHKDGWGVVRFDGQVPQAERGLEAAGASARFAELGEALESRSLLAHIRLASVGPVSLQNSHPFLGQGWAFMHNGTVKNFEVHQAALEARLAVERRARLVGETESERCFQLFLQRLEGDALVSVARALARVQREIVEQCDGDSPVPASLNFLVSDGRRLVAARHGRTLWLYRGDQVRVVASERLWPEGEWEEVAEDEVIGVDADLSVHRWSARELA